ncbi:MAG: DUF86 domain-containing protein [Dehalococcoidales bacterium]|nr:DUF86 domain-containing protein [Dehalococcoidales bacterium]
MLESISLIENYTADIGKERFLKSSQIQDAVIRRLEIIGEARISGNECGYSNGN